MAAKEDWREAMECLMEMIRHDSKEEVLCLLLLPDCIKQNRVCLIRRERGSFTSQFVMDRLHSYFGVVRDGRSALQGVVALVPMDDGPFDKNSLVERIEGFPAKGAVMLVKESELGVIGEISAASDIEDEDEVSDDY